MTSTLAALNTRYQLLTAYTATSKRKFYMKDQISTFTLQQGYVPLNPFQIFGFLNDTVDRNLVRQANNTLIRIANEFWVFGEVSDGVLAEIKQAKEQRKPIKYFRIENSKDIIEILNLEEVVMEKNVKTYRNLL
ncbi:hypothetical protein J4223_01900 [Candidatus Woesearchaeota archaeon]|nr:hypothetical protein [Candidatus Woesearchaeota archaeon]